jgi:hypothetical protein
MQPGFLLKEESPRKLAEEKERLEKEEVEKRAAAEARLRAKGESPEKPKLPWQIKAERKAVSTRKQSAVACGVLHRASLTECVITEGAGVKASEDGDAFERGEDEAVQSDGQQWEWWAVAG